MVSTTAAIYFHPEAYSTGGNDLKGRNAAGESFLKGYLQHSSQDEFFCYVKNLVDAEDFVRQVSDRKEQKAKIITFDRTPALTLAQTLFYPGPDIGDIAFQRSNIDPTGWSICGITHTTSSARAMDAIASLIISEVEPWDAVICTSSAVKRHVENILTNELERLTARLGIRKSRLPILPIIPLGVNTDDFIFSETEKLESRDKLNIKREDIVILYMGRLSFHAKAHPAAMYSALEKAAKDSGKRLTLIECGWFANSYTEAAYSAASNELCPAVKIIRLDGRKRENRRLVWAVADIFCSLSDNIQETFGITPVEAMAAGIPVVASDWNGYKDTIRHGKDGFLVKTSLPQPGLGGDLALRHAMGIDNYDYYCGYNCMHTAVDIEETTLFLKRLIENRELRLSMGKIGRERAISTYDWKGIIGQYEELWSELGESRYRARNSDDNLKKPQIWPARMDPFTSFAHYPTYSININSIVERVIANEENAIEQLEMFYNLEIIKFSKDILPSIDTATEILKKIKASGSKVEQVIRIGEEEAALQLRAVSFLQKLGLIRVKK
ncbi:MAG: glycosyl transferase-like protein [Pelagibacterales bacterium]|nr:glycosyl transferase-like protein [Pelagibacterales bacterium]|tara:strand:- start:225 stop:1886 length:1662 start_codon:yes stop_codon:yes gene_type:complete